MAINNEFDYLPDDPGNPENPGGEGGTPNPANFGTQVFARPFTKLDPNSALDITCYLNLYSADDLRFSAYVFVDDVLVNTGTTNAIYDETNSKGQGTMTIPAIVEGVGAGNHVLYVRVKNRENEAALIVQAGSQLKIAELFQGGR